MRVAELHTNDSTHRRNVETEQTAADNGSGCNHVEVPDSIHGLCTPQSKEKQCKMKDTREKKKRRLALDEGKSVLYH
jgi:hypothetical protein